MKARVLLRRGSIEDYAAVKTVSRPAVTRLPDTKTVTSLPSQQPVTKAPRIRPKDDTLEGWTETEKSMLVLIKEQLEDIELELLDCAESFGVLDNTYPVVRHFTALQNGIDSLRERIVKLYNLSQK